MTEEQKTKEDLEKKIQIFILSGKHIEAARIAEHAGMTERAIELYLQAAKTSDKYSKNQIILTAANLAEKSGQVEKAIGLYLQAEAPLPAAKMAEQTGQTEKAIELYLLQAEKITQYLSRTREHMTSQEYQQVRWNRRDVVLKAANLAEKSGQVEKAIELLKNAAEPLFAAKIAEQAGMTERAIELYLWANLHYPVGGGLGENPIALAGRLAEKTGQTNRAISLYAEQDKEYCEAQNLARRRPELTEKVIDALIVSGRELYAGNVAAHAGMIERAIALKQRIRPDLAADIAQRAGMTEQAIELYIQAGNPLFAGYVAKKAGQTERAIDLCLQAKRPDEAIKIAEEAKIPLDNIMAKYEKN